MPFIIIIFFSSFFLSPTNLKKDAHTRFIKIVESVIPLLLFFFSSLYIDLYSSDLCYDNNQDKEIVLDAQYLWNVLFMKFSSCLIKLEWMRIKMLNFCLVIL